MKLLSTAGLLAVFLPIGVFAQGPDGSDINKAIPIYFGQTITDLGDVATKGVLVYSITLAKGQSITALASKLPATTASSTWNLFLLRPSTTSIKSYQGADVLACRGVVCSDGVNNAQDHLAVVEEATLLRHPLLRPNPL